tara:strand:+ start:414 stop:971 length:558 start_codon:yes stop_codon:yes gene_type:complete
MRKTLIVFSVAFTTFLIGQIRISADLGGKIGDGQYDNDTKMGITLGYDHALGSWNNINYGVGVEYQLNRGLDIQGAVGYEPKFGFTSIYLFDRYNINPTMYVGTKLGYAISFNGNDDLTREGADLSGGLMWSFGFGYSINDQMIVESGYASNAGTSEVGSVEEENINKSDITYTRVYFAFIYNFK